MPLSDTQMKYLALAWQCFDVEPKVDYEKFKTIANLASAHSARELLRVTKKKLREEYGDGTTTPKTPTATASTPRKRAAPGTEGKKSTGKKAAGGGHGDHGGEVEESPAKRQKGKKNARADSAGPGVVVKDEAGDEEEEGEDVFN